MTAPVPDLLPWQPVSGFDNRPVPMLFRANDGKFEYVVWRLDSIKWPGYQTFTSVMRTRTNDRRIREHRRLEEIPTLEQAVYLCQCWAMAGDPRGMVNPDDITLSSNRKRAA